MEFLDKEIVITVIEDIRKLFYPYLLEKVKGDLVLYQRQKKESIKKNLQSLMEIAFRISGEERESSIIINNFMESLDKVKDCLEEDINFFLESDPASTSRTEVLLSYPGIYAILVYRVAHILYCEKVPLIPRLMSEHAHSITGIDIHPGAKIGEKFFIDHGTGVVIGETTIIGNGVKIYQGVTLGALSLGKGKSLKNIKRHPTINDNVTIYSGASIFGGETIIGKNVTVGSNVFITSSISENTKVALKNQELMFKDKNN